MAGDISDTGEEWSRTEWDDGSRLESVEEGEERSSICETDEQFMGQRGEIGVPNNGREDEDHELWRPYAVSQTYNSSQLAYILNPPPEEPRMLKPKVKRDYLKENRMAISEMSTYLHAQKQRQQRIESQGPEDWLCKRQDCSKLTERKIKSNTNSVAMNMDAMKQVTTPDAEPDQDCGTHYDTPGKVPPYILEGKGKLAQNIKQRHTEMESEKCLPGNVLMAESVRQAARLSLEQNQAELIYRLQSFPLVVETPRLVKSKSAVEQKLRETEKALHRYSQSNVHIAVPSKTSSRGSRNSTALSSPTINLIKACISTPETLENALQCL